MAFQETRLGLIPDLGGTVRLSKLIGPGNAKDLVFSCRKIDADESKAMGLVQQIFDKNGFMEQVMAYTKQIISNSPAAISAVKNIVHTTHGLPLEKALEIERENAANTLMTLECFEGIGAFLEKRPPKWR